MTPFGQFLNWIKSKWDELDETPEWLVGRDDWGAAPARPAEAPISFINPVVPETLDWPLPYVVVHSSRGFRDPGDDPDKIKCVLRQMQQEHMEDRDVEDILYNFMVGQDGRVYEGRGWATEGDHTMDYNEVSIGVCFIGNFLDDPANPKMIAVTRELVKEGMLKGYLTPDVEVLPHSEAVEGAECPSKALRDQLTALTQSGEANEGDREKYSAYQSLTPDRNWAEWGWLYSAKRFLDGVPSYLVERTKSRWKLFKTAWKVTLLRQIFSYIWNN